METPGDDSLHLELTQLVEDQKGEESRARQERNLRVTFFVAPALALFAGHFFVPRFWFLLLVVPVIAAICGAQFKGSEERFHALFWGNVLAIGVGCLLQRLGSFIPVV